MTKKTKILEVAAERKTINLREYMTQYSHPILCLGPMSLNIVEATTRIANRFRKPIPLIASRRQVDCEEFGGGYVNKWNTASFANYVHSRDRGYVPLCRDHGGPWQGTGEDNLSNADAMKRAKESLLEDIRMGFEVIHIDPSIHGGSMTDQYSLNMIFELYGFVCESAKQLGKKISIEIGSEQQSGNFSDPQELVTLLYEVTKFCELNHFEKPLFCVVQTGTLVREMRNVGLTDGRKNESYDQRFAVETIEKNIRYLADIAYINGVYIKEHNGDYLSDGSMSSRKNFRVGAVNIAPELGVFESKSLVSLCVELNLKSLTEKMLGIFYNSKKWEKWLSPDTTASDVDKALMAGHYTFSTPEFQEAKLELIENASKKQNINVDEFIISNITSLIRRYLWNLGYFNLLQVNGKKEPILEMNNKISICTS